jgi:hypothetical protein
MIRGNLAGWSLVAGVFCGTLTPCAAQDFSGRELTAAMAKIEQMRRDGKEVPPAPKLPDGHPDFGNGAGSWYAPSVGDMSGGQKSSTGGFKPEKPADVILTPAAKKLFDERVANLAKDDPEAACLPPGIPRVSATSFPFQIYQQPDRIIFLYEKLNLWRIVYMDGRKHTPKQELNPTFYGESIGHWEGDTLVVDVIGQNDRSWVDSSGHPKTEQIHVTERWRRVNAMIMHYEATIDDPGAYEKPWTTSWNILFHPGAELLEYICIDNKDPEHLVGK